MQNNNGKISDKLLSKTKIYLAIIFILLVIICIESAFMIIPYILIFGAVVGYSYYATNRRKSEISETLQDLTLSVDTAAKSSLINSPFPLIILESNGNIIWRSSKFISEFSGFDINKYLNNLIEDIKLDIKETEKDETKEKQISRQAVLDSISKSCQKLDEYEKTLHLLNKKQEFKEKLSNIKNQKTIKEIKQKVDEILGDI